MGGVAGIVLGLAYLAIIPLYVIAGAPPTGVEPKLLYLGAHTSEWWAILGLSVLTDLLFVPFAIALYRALRDTDENTMLFGAAFILLFAVLDLAVTWTNYGALIRLGARYTASDPAERGAIVAAATYASAVLESIAEVVYSIGVPALGILLVGLVMRRAVFGRLTAYLGVLTGVLGIATVAAWPAPAIFGIAVIVMSSLTTVWILASGFRLYRLAR